MRKIKVSDIIITDAFSTTNPSEKKMNKYRSMWDKFNRQPKYITVNESNILIDGYIQYLLLKEKDKEDAECLIRHSDKKNNINTYKTIPTTYIYGKHINSGCDKEFIWRVPNSWEDVNIQVGDTVLCQTKFGKAPVIVTKVETLDRCPVSFRVKRVIKKFSERMDSE